MLIEYCLFPPNIATDAAAAADVAAAAAAIAVQSLDGHWYSLHAEQHWLVHARVQQSVQPNQLHSRPQPAAGPWLQLGQSGLYWHLLHARRHRIR